MKKLGIVLALILLAALALPPVLGMFTQEQVEARVAQLTGSALVSAEIHSFDRGWFSSTAKIDVALAPAYVGELQALGGRATDPRTGPALARLAEVLSRPLPVIVDLSHGPLTTRDGARFELSSMVARLDPERTDGLAELLATLDVPYLFEFRGHTGFDGKLHFDADIPPVDHTEGNDRLRWSGVVIDGTLGGRRLLSQARVDALEVESDPWRVHVEGFSSAGDNELLPRRLLIGSFDMQVDRAMLELGGEPLLEVADATFASDIGVGETGTLIDAQLRHSATVLRAGGAYELTDAAFGVTVRNVDIHALQAAYHGGGPRSLAASGQLEPLLTPILSASPAVVLDPIRFHLNGEPFDARAAAEVDGDGLPAGPLDLRDRSLWIEVLSGTGAVTLSKALAERLAVEIGTRQLQARSTLPTDELEAIAESQVTLVLLLLEAQGFVRTVGDDLYTAELSYAGGTLRINDQPLPLRLLGSAR